MDKKTCRFFHHYFTPLSILIKSVGDSVKDKQENDSPTYRIMSRIFFATAVLALLLPKSVISEQFVDITPNDMNSRGECKRFVSKAKFTSKIPCEQKLDGQLKTYKELTGVEQLNVLTYYLCHGETWYKDRKKSYTYNDTGPPFIDRCKYIDNFVVLEE